MRDSSSLPLCSSMLLRLVCATTGSRGPGALALATDVNLELLQRSQYERWAKAGPTPPPAAGAGGVGAAAALSHPAS